MMFSLIKLGYLLVTFIFINFCKSLFSVEKYLDSFTTSSAISSIYLIFSLAILYHKNIDNIKKIEKYALINIIYITFYYDYLIKLNLNIIDFYIINFFIQFLFILIETIFTGIYSCKNEEIEIENKEKILPSREIIANSIDYYLENNVQSILIDGEWGSGKTFFIKDFLKKRKEKYIPIWIKSTLFESKNEIKKYVFEELKCILEKNRILVSPINDIMKKFEIIGQNSFINFSKCYSSIEEDFKAIKDSVSEIKEKKIIIIIDDLERISNKELAKDILSLISEIEENIDIKIFVLSSLKEFLKEKDYFDKYYEVHIKLSDISSEEIIEAFFDSNILKESINNFINELSKDQHKTLETEDFLKKLKNPRHLKRASIELNRLEKNNREEQNKIDNKVNKNLSEKLHLIYTLISFQLLRKTYPTTKILETESNSLYTLESIYNELVEKLDLRTNSFRETLKLLDENNGLNYEKESNKNKPYNEQAKELMELGLNKKAIELLDEAIIINQNNYLLGELYTNRGISKARLGMNEEAIKDFEQSLNIKQTNSLALIFSGDCKSKLGMNEEAIRDYMKALELEPNNTSLYFNIGNIKNSLGDLEGAMANYNEVIKLDSKDAMAYNNRGSLKCSLGDLEGALEDYNEVLKLDPNHFMAYANRGVIRGFLKDSKGAMQDYNKAIELNAKCAEAYNNRGALKELLKDLEGAMQDYNKAIESDSKYIKAHNNRANLKKKMDVLEETDKDYDKVKS